jgi:transcriptional regulator with XRE-family HTH domain
MTAARRMRRMNNLRLWRESRGLKQTELAAMVKPIDARIDSSMISRFENEMCLPTPSVSKALASALNVPESLLFGGTEQLYISGVVDGEARAEPESMDVTDLIAHFREAGKGAAISRRALASMMDVSDRHLRRIIEEARNCGYLIINDSDGTGYFLAASSADIERHFRQENARALSILKRLKAARTRLKEVGAI